MARASKRARLGSPFDSDAIDAEVGAPAADGDRGEDDDRASDGDQGEEDDHASEASTQEAEDRASDGDHGEEEDRAVDGNDSEEEDRAPDGDQGEVSLSAQTLIMVGDLGEVIDVEDGEGHEGDDEDHSDEIESLQKLSILVAGYITKIEDNSYTVDVKTALEWIMVSSKILESFLSDGKGKGTKPEVTLQMIVAKWTNLKPIVMNMIQGEPAGNEGDS